MIPARAFRSAAVVLGLALLATAWLSQRPQPVVVATNLERLPLTIGEYTGVEDRFPESVYRVLNADRHVYRHYSSGPARLDLYIGYYGTAKGGRTGHNPLACLPGAGWGLEESSRVRLVSPGHPQGVEVNYVLARKEGRYVHLFHWYQTAGNRVVVSGIQQNLGRLVGRVLHNRDDGAFVQVSTFAQEQALAPARAEGLAFAAAVVDLLPRYWPEER